MHDLEKQLKESFDAVHAEPSLGDAAMARIRQERARRSKFRFSSVFRAVLTAACMVVLFLGGYGTRMFLEPVNVISIDINPSIELGVNAFDRVVTADAYNPEGSALLETLDLRLRTWENALEQVVSSDTVQTLLQGKDSLIVTVIGKTEEKSQRFCREVLDTIGQTPNVHCLSAAVKTVESAHSCGLSYGKYLAYLDALAVDATLTPEMVQTMTMRQIRELAGITGGHGHHHGSQEETTLPTEETTEPTVETTAPMDAHHGHEKKHKKGHH